MTHITRQLSDGLEVGIPLLLATKVHSDIPSLRVPVATVSCCGSVQTGLGDLPAEVLSLVRNNITAKEIKAMCAVSSSWASVVRRNINEISIHATPESVNGELLTIRQRQHHYPRARFILSVNEKLPSDRLERLLLSVKNLGTDLPHCTLAVQLSTIHPAQERLFAAVVPASACLQERGVLVSITLCAKRGWLPSTNDLWRLAPFLQGVHYHTHPEFLTPVDTTSRFAGQVSTLAGMANLRKLQLNFPDSLRPPDFRPLAQLTCLQDLALRCQGCNLFADPECSQVIDSNASSLQHLKLESRSWTDMTYAAVGRVATLKDVDFKVAVLSDSSAALVSSLVHPRSVKVSVCHCRQMTVTAFCALSSGSARITSLSLSWISSAQCQQLQSMASLQHMVIESPTLTAGHSFHHQQPELTSLLLVDCLTLSHVQVQNLVAKFPMLEDLAFEYDPQMPPLADTVTLDTAGLAALTHASKLSTVSLVGAQGVSDELINAFEAHFVLEHKAGRAQKKLGLCLPDRIGTRRTLYQSYNLEDPAIRRSPTVRGQPFWFWLTCPPLARCDHMDHIDEESVPHSDEESVPHIDEESVPQQRIVANKRGHVVRCVVKSLAIAMSIMFTIEHARLRRERRLFWLDMLSA